MCECVCGYKWVGVERSLATGRRTGSCCRLSRPVGSFQPVAFTTRGCNRKVRFPTGHIQAPQVIFRTISFTMSVDIEHSIPWKCARKVRLSRCRSGVANPACRQADTQPAWRMTGKPVVPPDYSGELLNWPGSMQIPKPAISLISLTADSG